MICTPQASREFDDFDNVAQARFIDHIGRLVRGAQKVKAISPDQRDRMDGARFAVRAAKELRILFDETGGNITLIHLVRRNDKRYFNSEY